MGYLKENGNIYKTEEIGAAEIKLCIGSEKRLELVSETEKEKAYQWQKFDFEKEEYVADEENTDTVNIGGKPYIPEKGKVVIKKEKTAIEKKITDMELALAEGFEESQKLREQVSAANIAIAELYEGSLGKNA